MGNTGKVVFFTITSLVSLFGLWYSMTDRQRAVWWPLIVGAPVTVAAVADALKTLKG